MGFLKTCVDFLLQLAPFSTFDNHYQSQQQPLAVPVPRHGVIVHPETNTKGFYCHYPGYRGWESCNGPNSRGCWIRDRYARQPLFTQFDIDVNYEKTWPEGITREYWLSIDDAVISPDGYLKTAAKVFNNTYPGPVIEACWGDDLVIHVTNHVKTNGSTIHWHGIRQLGTNDADGVNGVTQCPIAPGDTYTYRFKAVQYGHTWYHSHYSLQYPDGVAGKLLIHGPNSGNWDIAFDPIFVNDWSHNSAFADFQQELEGAPPPMQSILLDGHGNYTCTDDEKTKNPGKCVGGTTKFERIFKRGKRYLLRLINASTESTFIFSIDDHLLQVISADFVPITPYYNESVLIGIGQRYSVIVEAKPSADPNVTDDNYWIRTILAQNCGSISSQGSTSTTGIIRYDESSTTYPTSTQHKYVPTLCSDEPYESLIPIVPWIVGNRPANDVEKDTFEAGLDLTRLQHEFFRWDLTNTSLWLNFSHPTISYLHNTTWDDSYCIVDENYDDKWIYLVITASQIPNNPAKGFFGAHPIHLHGHDFALIGQSTQPWNVSESPKQFNYTNPPRRDVALLPRGGWIALAFKSDNPGIWLVHCHIAWHASSGLAMQILERQNEIEGIIGKTRLAATKHTCDNWNKWLNGTYIDQNDSGEPPNLVQFQVVFETPGMSVLPA